MMEIFGIIGTGILAFLSLGSFFSLMTDDIYDEANPAPWPIYVLASPFIILFVLMAFALVVSVLYSPIYIISLLL